MTVDPDLLAARDTVRQSTGAEAFDFAVVLGSGLGEAAEQVDEAIAIPYGDLPCIPPPTVSGHAGRLIAGRLSGARVLFFQGRSHLYEGHSARQAGMSVRLAHALGCRRLLLTNAVGGIAEALHVGDFVYLSDHINLMGDNPLRGETDHPFLDLSQLYDQSLFPPLSVFARQNGIALQQGVLAALTGPSYETPAEIRMLQRLGADVVSMSLVPEAITGKYLGMQVSALSFVANAAAGLAAAPLNHQDVLDAGRRGGERLALLVRHLVHLCREIHDSV